MMTFKALARLFAAACVVGASLAPTQAHAANVGYYGSCYGEDPTGPIVAAGHTPVAVGSLTAANLVGLSALFVNSCDFATNADVDAAVAAGMTLLVHDPFSSVATLPGGVSATRIGASDSDDLEFASGIPILDGPGGALTDSTLDQGSSSNHGAVALAALPGGSVVFVTTPVTSEVVTFYYVHGMGRVLYSTIPLGCYFAGGNCDQIQPAAQGMEAYAANVIAWAAGPAFTSCAAEGFTGAKLYQCRQICEVDQNPYHLAKLIKLYRMVFREDPPCAN